VRERPDVSVVIVAWRARADVLRCLAALQRDAGVSYEVIVVDDGSGDDTGSAVRRRFPDASVVEKRSNEGLVRGRNTALPIVRGRYVLMIDADTEVRPGALPALVAALGRADVGIAAPRLLNEDGSLQLSCRRYPPLLLPLLRRGPLARIWPNPRSHQRHLMMDFDHEQARPVVWVSGAAQMWRAELPARIGPYDDRISSYGGEDLDWCLRTWAAGAEVWYVPEAEIVHRWQKLTNRSPFSLKSFRALRDWYYLQWKHRRLRADPRLRKANA